MIIGHGGNIHEAAARAGCPVSRIVDMSSNVNPLGCVPGLFDHLAQGLDRLVNLPEADAAGCVADFCRWMNVDPRRVVAGAGTTQFIYTLPRILGAESALVAGPTYADYADACALAGVDTALVVADEAHGFVPSPDRLAKAAQGRNLAFVCHPNNPTGQALDTAALTDLIRSRPHTLFVVDESYLWFDEDLSTTLCHERLPNLVVLVSLSKVFGLAGLRIGFLCGPPEIVDQVRPHLWPWGVNALAEQAVAWLAEHSHRAADHVAATHRFLDAERTAFFTALEDHPGITLYPGAGSFVLARLHRGTSRELWEHLVSRRILIRDCSNFAGLTDRHVRFSLKSSQDNSRLAMELNEWLDSLPATRAAG